MKFLCGQTFVDVADFIFTAEEPDDYYKFPNTFTVEAVNASSVELPIIYTRTSLALKIFPLLERLKRDVVLITCNADTNVNGDLYDVLPDTVVKWYSQNVKHKGDLLESIPIGIENTQRFEFHHIHKPMRLEYKVTEPKKHKRMLYVNHSIWTNRKERFQPYVLLKDKPFATVEPADIFDFERYIDNIYNHKFVLCPPGNGIDTHRTWETMYLKSIPIEKRNINNSFYQDLPICFVDNWEDITEDFLNREYERITQGTWNMAKLTPEFWAEKIRPTK